MASYADNVHLLKIICDVTRDIDAKLKVAMERDINQLLQPKDGNDAKVNKPIEKNPAIQIYKQHMETKKNRIEKISNQEMQILDKAINYMRTSNMQQKGQYHRLKADLSLQQTSFQRVIYQARMTTQTAPRAAPQTVPRTARRTVPRAAPLTTIETATQTDIGTTTQTFILDMKQDVDDTPPTITSPSLAPIEQIESAISIDYGSDMDATSISSVRSMETKKDYDLSDFWPQTESEIEHLRQVVSNFLLDSHMETEIENTTEDSSIFSPQAKRRNIAEDDKIPSVGQSMPAVLKSDDSEALFVRSVQINSSTIIQRKSEHFSVHRDQFSNIEDSYDIYKAKTKVSVPATENKPPVVTSPNTVITASSATQVNAQFTKQHAQQQQNASYYMDSYDISMAARNVTKSQDSLSQSQTRDKQPKTTPTLSDNTALKRKMRSSSKTEESTSKSPVSTRQHVSERAENASSYKNPDTSITPHNPTRNVTTEEKVTAIKESTVRQTATPLASNKVQTPAPLPKQWGVYDFRSEDSEVGTTLKPAGKPTRKIRPFIRK